MALKAKSLRSHKEIQAMNTGKWGAVLLPFTVAATWSAFAHADDVVVTPAPQETPPTQTRSETVTSKGGPSEPLLMSGVLTLGLTYGAAAVVAATSSLDADHRMFVPVAGPWMALFNRGGCGGPIGPSCDTQTADRVLIAADGIGQALGAFMIIDAFLNPETITVSRSTTADDKPTLRFAPSSMGSGYGLLAIGKF
jgi:hypothetical protein